MLSGKPFFTKQRIAFILRRIVLPKPKQIIIFREGVAKIRKLISSNQALSANNVFQTLPCPSDEQYGEYEKIKNEVDAAIAKYAEADRQLYKEVKRKIERRKQEIRKQQEEKERAERQRLAS